MLHPARLICKTYSKRIWLNNQYQICRLYSRENVNPEFRDQEFQPLVLYPKRNVLKIQRKQEAYKAHPPRSKQMDVKQDWGNVWPGPRSFHPATVPLPIRQGYQEKAIAAPDKFANAELMKIPNFLHLTPPVIKRQCEALKKYCTPWPKGLETDELCEEHFPVQYITSDYVHGLPSIRNPLSRIITIKFKLSALPLDDHARDKFLRLIEDRHDPDTDYVTIVVDRCPLKQQNFDFAQYLMTALFHESFVFEDWEAEKMEADMETYYWYRNKSKVTAEGVANWSADGKKPSPEKEVDPNYGKAVENLINEGENEYNVRKYKEEVLKLIGLEPFNLP